MALSVLENALNQVLEKSQELAGQLRLERMALRGTLPPLTEANPSLDQLREELEQAQGQVVEALESLAASMDCSSMEVLSHPVILPLKPLRRRVSAAREQVESEARMTRYVLEHYRGVVLRAMGSSPMVKESGYGPLRPRSSGMMVNQVC